MTDNQTGSAGVTVGNAIGIIPHPYCYDQWLVIQVVKRGRVMWEFRSLRHDGEWGEVIKRKVSEFLPLTGDPLKARERLQSACAHYTKVCRDARVNLANTVKKIASLPTPPEAV